MSDLQVSDERMAAVGTIDVRIRSDEYTPDESDFLCVHRVDLLQELVDTVTRWGVTIDGNTYGGMGSISGSFAIGRHGTFFDLVVDTGTDA
jgi:hypothetical protein